MKKIIITIVVLMFVYTGCDSTTSESIGDKFSLDAQQLSNVEVTRFGSIEEADNISITYDITTFKETFNNIISAEVKEVELNFIDDILSFVITFVDIEGVLYHFEIFNSHILVTESDEFSIVYEIDEDIYMKIKNSIDSLPN